MLARDIADRRQIDATTGTVKWDLEHAHEAPVNRVHCVNQQLVASGDDEGVIKFWDPRKPKDPIRTYTHHWDYISDFTYFEDKRHLVATSGDGHLSAIDIRVSKPEPAHTSADQEDELLSITPIKGGEKFVVGTGLGVLSVWNRKLGWDDSVDRMMGHPASVDAVVALTEDIVATGSEDGMVRVIQIQPNTFREYKPSGARRAVLEQAMSWPACELGRCQAEECVWTTLTAVGVIATHDEYPIERLALDRNAKWLGSVSHDECIKLTNCEGIFEDDSGAEDVDMEGGNDNDSDEEGEGAMDEDEDSDEEAGAGEGEGKEEKVDWGSDSDDEPAPQPKKKQRKNQHKVGKDPVHDTEKGFFDDL